MTSHLSTIELRQNEILNCVRNLYDLAGSSKGDQFYEELDKITTYAYDTSRLAISYCEHIRHQRRERKRRKAQRLNKNLNEFHHIFQE